MVIQNILLAAETYTYDGWLWKDVCVGFSRLYYIIDGEGYYEEDGKAIRFKKNHLYLTPVKKCFTLYDNPQDKLLHTHCHITTLPAVERLLEVEVVEGTPLADAVALWRKYIYSDDTALLINILQLVLACMDQRFGQENVIAEKVKEFIDGQQELTLDMAQLSRRLGYSREHITRSFLSVYHITPKQYFNQQRMRIALEKLLNGVGVNEVSDELHYSSPYAFSKAFKKHFGSSPTKYIKMLHPQRTKPHH